MDVPAVVFRQYDIRGIVGDELTPQLAHAVGRALTPVGRSKLGRDPRVAVGRDKEVANGACTANPEQQRKKVKAVAMEMWATFEKVAGHMHLRLALSTTSFTSAKISTMRSMRFVGKNTRP